uniref:Methylamine utilization protein MauL n=2 Tax=Methylobacillus flagellatus TaxID=405 RepID=MAUL_METFK|nr:RecName: Full=Methylamine utilization protein MauL [Methylobacillus flagellatus KT]AAC41471.1 putative [Methylobacillus flagellatus]prf//2117328J mauL gene [Methylobacillus flagellatus]
MLRNRTDAVHDRVRFSIGTRVMSSWSIVVWMFHRQTWQFLLTTGFILCISSIAWSAEVHQMELTHHEFEPWSFVPKPGDRIDIHNHSDIVHAIYVTYPNGIVVNLSETAAQLPGMTVSWTVPEDAEDGDEYVLQCWIHTIIRAALKVKAPLSQLPEP